MKIKRSLKQAISTVCAPYVLFLLSFIKGCPTDTMVYDFISVDIHC